MTMSAAKINEKTLIHSFYVASMHLNSDVYFHFMLQFFSSFILNIKLNKLFMKQNTVIEINNILAVDNANKFYTNAAVL